VVGCYVPLRIWSICRSLEIDALIQGGSPAGEQRQSVMGWAVGFGAVGGEGQAGVGRELHDFEGQAEVADDGVVELFGAGERHDEGNMAAIDR
jgi:hypothetical protein